MLQVGWWRWLIWGWDQVSPGDTNQEQIEKNPHSYLPQTPFKTPFIAHTCPWWGFFKTDRRKNLVWFTSELKQYVENQNWVVATPLRGDLKRYGEGKSLTGRAVCSTLCGPPCTERKGTWDTGRHDLLGAANGLALSGEARTKAQGLVSSRHSLTPTPVFSGGYFCYPHLQIRKLRYRGV